MRFAAAAVLACSIAAAQTGPQIFFVSPAGNDAASGVSPLEPWRSLARVQKAIDQNSSPAGLEVRFRRGGAYAGSLSIRGFTGPLLRLTAYGRGAAPVLSGAVALDQWTPLGNHLWRAECPACAAMPNLVMRDGAALPLARWPNPDGAHRGYLAYQSAEGRTQITSDQLPADVDWTGAEAVLRSAAWVLDRLPVQRQAGKTLTFASPASYAIPAGYGFFLQNHPAALDQDGEWIFDAATSRITLFLAGTTPESHHIEAAAVGTILAVSRSRNVEIAGIELVGARQANLDIADSENVTLRGVRSGAGGDTGVRCLNCRNLRIADSVVDGALNHGLDVFNCADCRVERNRILNTATIAGLGGSGNGRYNAVRFGGANAVFADNEVARSGYLGIDVRGAATLARNTISEFNLVKTDGGGIYTWGNRGVIIADNLVRDGAGSRAGVPWSSNATHGIYIDDQSEDVQVRGNTVLNVASYGVFLHNTRNVEVAENTVVGAREAQIAFVDDDLGSYTVSGTSVRDNVLVATNPGALLARAGTTGPLSFFTAIGAMAGNRYCSPFADPVFGSSVSGQPKLLPAQWQRLVGTDADAVFCPQRFSLYTGVAAEGPNRVQNGAFDRDISGWFGWPGDSLQAAWAQGALELRHTASAPVIHYDAPVGTIEAGKLYRAQFDARSDDADRWMRVYLRKWDPDYRLLGNALDVVLGREWRRYDFLIPAAETETRSLLIFELPSASKVVWLDNVSLEPARAQAVQPDDLIRVELNRSPEYRAVKVEDGWTGAGATIPPYRSLVLFRAQ